MPSDKEIIQQYPNIKENARELILEALEEGDITMTDIFDLLNEYAGENINKKKTFILIANNLSKIIAPIQSRCVVFKFTKISDKEILSQLKSIAKKEKIKTDENGLNAISDYTNGDLRHAINILQAAASSGNVTEPVVKSIVGLTKTKDVQDVLKLALGGKNYNNLNLDENKITSIKVVFEIDKNIKENKA